MAIGNGHWESNFFNGYFSPIVVEITISQTASEACAMCMYTLLTVRECRHRRSWGYLYCIISNYDNRLRGLLGIEGFRIYTLVFSVPRRSGTATWRLRSWRDLYCIISNYAIRLRGLLGKEAFRIYTLVFSVPRRSETATWRLRSWRDLYCIISNYDICHRGLLRKEAFCIYMLVFSVPRRSGTATWLLRSWRIFATRSRIWKRRSARSRKYRRRHVITMMFPSCGENYRTVR